MFWHECEQSLTGDRLKHREEKQRRNTHVLTEKILEADAQTFSRRVRLEVLLRMAAMAYMTVEEFLLAFAAFPSAKRLQKSMCVIVTVIVAPEVYMIFQ